MIVYPARTYVVVLNRVVISTAITLIEVTAPSTGGLVVIAARITQHLSTTSAMAQAEIVRKSAAGTGTGSATNAYKINPNDPANSFTHRGQDTAEGTVTDIPEAEGFNVLNGWHWRPTPQEYLFVPPSGIIGIRFAVAPASATWTAILKVGEVP